MVALNAVMSAAWLIGYVKNPTGIDFSMTALFVVSVLNQWLDSKEHRPALLGAVLGILCLLLFGPDKFLLPALTFTALILLGVKRRWNMQ